jgi:hypothetical protein
MTLMGDIGEPVRRIEVIPAGPPVLPPQPAPVRVPDREPTPPR